MNNKGIGPFKRELVTGAFDWIDKWKVIMSYLTYDHAGRADKDGKRRIFSTMEVLPPKVVCTEIYIVVDTFNSEIEAKNLLQYLKTKFVRFLVAQVTTTQHISKANFALVPIQDFSKEWTDAELYKFFIEETTCREMFAQLIASSCNSAVSGAVHPSSLRLLSNYLHWMPDFYYCLKNSLLFRLLN